MTVDEQWPPIDGRESFQPDPNAPPPADIKLTRQQKRVLAHVKEEFAGIGASPYTASVVLKMRPYWAMQHLDALKRLRYIETRPHLGSTGYYTERYFIR